MRQVRETYDMESGGHMQNRRSKYVERNAAPSQRVLVQGRDIEKRMVGKGNKIKRNTCVVDLAI